MQASYDHTRDDNPEFRGLIGVARNLDYSARTRIRAAITHYFEAVHGAKSAEALASKREHVLELLHSSHYMPGTDVFPDPTFQRDSDVAEILDKLLGLEWRALGLHNGLPNRKGTLKLVAYVVDRLVVLAQEQSGESNWA